MVSDLKLLIFLEREQVYSYQTMCFKYLCLYANLSSISPQEKFLKKENLKHQQTKRERKRIPPRKARTNNRMNPNIIKLIVIIMFPWGLWCNCPCTCCEPQPTSTSPRVSPLPLGWCLDLLRALWGPLRLWSGPILACACSQSPQLPELDCFHLWEHSLYTQIFHRCRVYLADYEDLICSLYSWWKGFRSSSLVTPSLGFTFSFIPTSACGPPTGVWSWGCLGALGSGPVRTGCSGGMTSWITGALAVPNVEGSRRPWEQGIWP